MYSLARSNDTRTPSLMRQMVNEMLSSPLPQKFVLAINQSQVDDFLSEGKAERAQPLLRNCASIADDQDR